MPKSIVDWFDINNPQHIAAYQHVCDKGVWPIDFIPNKKAVGFPAGWPGLLAGKIAESLLAQRIELDKVLIKAETLLDFVIAEGGQPTEFVQIRRTSAADLLGDISRALDPRRAQGEQR